MKRIIFLDFDGVINSAKFISDYINQFKAPTEKTYYIKEHIDPIAVARINKIIKLTGAEVVLSTAWRKAFKLEELTELLHSRGFVGKIIGETPITLSYRPRHQEIQQWLDENDIKPEQIVIIDDMPTMEHLNHRFAKTSFDVGVTDEHIELVLKLFNVNE